VCTVSDGVDRRQVVEQVLHGCVERELVVQLDLTVQVEGDVAVDLARDGAVIEAAILVTCALISVYLSKGL